MPLGMGQVTTDEDFVIVVIIADHTDVLRHAETGHHPPGHLGGLLDITGSPCGNILENDLLGNPSSQGYHNLLQHLPPGHEHLILLRKGHGIARSPHSGWNNGNRIHRPHIRQHMEQNGMPCLVVGRNLFLPVGNDPALLLCADTHLYEGLPDILLHHKTLVVLRRIDGSLVHQILQIRPCEPCRGLCHLLQIHILRQGLVPGVHLQNVLPAADVRRAHGHLPVKTPRTQDCGIQNVHPVCGCHHDNPFIDAEAVHLHQQLVQSLLPLVMASSHTGTPAPCNSIDLVNKDDTGRILLGLLKQIPDAGRAHTHKHFHKIGTGYTEKRNSSLPGHRLCQQGFTGSGRTLQQNALWNPGSHLGIFSGFPEKIHDLLQFLLFLLQARHLLKGDIFIPDGQPGPALAEIHHPAIVAPGILGIDHHKQEHAYSQDNQHGHQCGKHPSLPGHIPHRRVKAIGAHQFLRLHDIRDIKLHVRAIGQLHPDITRGNLAVGIDGHFPDPSRLHIADKLLPGIIIIRPVQGSQYRHPH